MIPMKADAARHTLISPKTARPRPYRGVLREIYRWMCWAFLRVQGWRFSGDWPHDPKFVIVAAPHTANWDGILMVAGAGYYRAGFSWMGKKSLGRGVLGWFLKKIGCIPVDRSKSGDVVAQMAAAFAAADTMMLAIPPEGTRAPMPVWKSGFYHIARAAGVPMLITVLDYGTKTVRISGVLEAGPSYEDDLAVIVSHYRGAKGKNPERFILPEVTAP